MVWCKNYDAVIELLRKISLRRRLLISSLILTFIPTLILGATIYVKSIRLFEEQAQTYSIEILGYIENQFFSIIDSLYDKTATALYSGPVQNAATEILYPREYDTYTFNPRILINALESILDEQINFTDLATNRYELMLVNRAGEPVLIDHALAVELIEPRELSGFIGAFNGRPQIEPYAPYILSITREFILVDKVYSAGAFRCLVENTVFEPLMTLVEQTGYISILDNDDALIYTSLPTEGLEAEFTQDLFSPDSSYDTLQLKNFQSEVENPDWTIVYSIPYSAINKPATELSLILLITALILLIFSTFFSLSIAASVNKPLSEIGTIIGKIEQGNYKLYVIPSGRDELTEIEVTLNRMTAEIDRLFNQVYQAQLRHREAQLEALQSQINPHFLFNTLDSIRWQARRNQDFEVAERVEILARMFRKVLSDPNEMTTITEEIEHTNNYLFLQKIRFGDRLNYSFAVDRKAEEAAVLQLLLQPLVENSIIHGLEPDLESITITVSVRINSDRLQLEVKDNGVGSDTLSRQDLTDFPSEHLSTSIGIQNVAQRLKLVYGEAGLIRIESSAGKGTTVSIDIPYERLIEE